MSLGATTPRIASFPLTPKQYDKATLLANQPKTGKSANGKWDNCKPCVYYKKGTCTKGNNCDYWHPPGCRWYKQGSCILGDKCVFIHNKPKSAAPAPKPKPDPKGKAKAEAKPKAKVKAKPKPDKNKKGAAAAMAIVDNGTTAEAESPLNE